MGEGSTLRAQLVRGALGAGGLKLLSLPLTLAVSILLARALGPEGYGQYAFVIALVSVLSIPIGPAMIQLMTRETASFHHAGDWGLLRGLLRWAHRWVLLGSLVIGGGLGVIAATRATWQVDDRWTVLFVGLFALPFLGLNALRAGALRGLLRVVIAQIPELVVRPGLQLAIVAVILLSGLLNPATAVGAYVAAAAAAFLVGSGLLGRAKPAEISSASARENGREWLWAWLPFTLMVVASTLNTQIGILLLGWMGSTEQVAALKVADRGAQLVVLSLAIVNMVIGPHITQAYRDGDRMRLQALSRQSARAALVVAFPVALALIAFGTPIVGAVFGADYVGLATTPLAILAAAQLVNVAFGSVAVLLMMSGYERDTLVGQVVALIINVAVATLLIPTFGAKGAAIAAAIGLCTWNLLLAFQVRHRLKLRPSAF